MDAARSHAIDTPLGDMIAVANDRGLLLCEFAGRPLLPVQLQRIQSLCGGSVTEGEHEVLAQTQAELDEYFAGKRETFTIPLVLAGTPFQSSVWNALLRVPFGATTSYEAIAITVGKAGAARAVGRANGDNRMAIIVPCHRVINANGSLSGYGGGRHRKQWLLNHEQRGAQFSLDV